MERRPVAPAGLCRRRDLDDWDKPFDELLTELRRAVRRQTWIICGAVLLVFPLSRALSQMN